MHAHVNKTHEDTNLETVIYKQKISKIKKVPKQMSVTKNVISKTITFISFCVGHLQLDMEKTNFSFEYFFLNEVVEEQ